MSRLVDVHRFAGRHRARYAVAAAIAIAVLAGCGSSGGGNGGGSGSSSSGGGTAASSGSSTDSGLHAKLPADIRQSGVIKNTINSPYPPMEFSNPGSTEYKGVDIDLAQAAAKELGVKLQFTNVQFPQIIPSLTTNRTDMVWSATLDLASRQNQITFIDYFKTGDQLYTSQANASKYHSLTDLCGKKVVVPAGTNYAQVLRRLSNQSCHGSAIDVLQADGFSGQKLEIQQGRADAGMIGVETILYAIKQQPNTFVTIGKPYDTGYYGVAFPKSKSQLRDAVLAALKKMKQDGTYQQLLSKWGLGKAGVSKFTVDAGGA